MRVAHRGVEHDRWRPWRGDIDGASDPAGAGVDVKDLARPLEPPSGGPAIQGVLVEFHDCGRVRCADFEANDCRQVAIGDGRLVPALEQSHDVAFGIGELSEGSRFR